MIENLSELKGTKKTSIAWLVCGGGLILLFFSILSYGLWNGNKIKKYALDSEKIITQTASWEQAFGHDGVNNIDGEMATINRDSVGYLNQLKKDKVPQKAMSLRNDLIEYFTITEKVSFNMKEVSDWFLDLEKSAKGLDNISLETGSQEQLVASLEKARNEMAEKRSELNSSKAPKGFEKQQMDFAKKYDEIIAFYDRIITASRSNDYAALLSAITDSNAIFSNLNSVESPTETLKITNKQDIDRASVLEKNILSKIDKLKNAWFSF